ncbi:MAG TPA: DUF5916 domain-containing protein [Vicinamibacterales bacterium]|nr:DUF5916 domain-containing protein [Vicinamibacterales bacterium]
MKPLLIAAACAALAAALPVRLAAQEPATDAPRKRAEAVRVANRRITVDGLLNEEEWQRVAPARNFVQQQPVENGTPTEPSEVRFLYDDDNLYVGAMLYDDEPERLITNELKRDFRARDGDLFVLVLDTFNDLRNSYGFQTNPGGAWRDTQSFDEGRTTNQNWDGVWSVKTSTVSGGWIVEYAIPFKTLRFSRSTDQEWGLSMMRLIRRKNEVTMWTSIPRQFSQFRMAYGGVLHGITGVQPGLNLRFKPFATGNVAKRSGRTSRDGDGGFDMKLGVGTGLVLDATYRTDFSQVEADAQQVNLTRFNLFFPEKREFFLENQGAFQIGRTYDTNDLVPFFSRSIGLENSLPVPIEGGLRLSGLAGRNDLGLLNIRTDDDNFSVLRYGRQFAGSSTANVFYLGKEGGGEFNRVAGADLRLAFNRLLSFDVLAMGSNEDAAGSGSAWRAGGILESNRTEVEVSFATLGDEFRDELGFIPRTGVDITHATALQRFRPKALARFLREWRPQLAYDRYQRAGFGVETATFRPNVTFEFQDGSTVTATVRDNEEANLEPFRVRSNYSIAPGRYTFTDGELSFATSRARALSWTGAYRTGGFWHGTRDGASGGVRVRVNQKVAASATMSRDVVELAGQSFTTDLLQLRLDTSFSTRMFLNAFVQYNGVTRDVSSNVRFDFIHHPLSDLFVVYNETRPTGTFLPPSRSFTVKLTHLLSF